MSGLRDRKKEQRRGRILDSAMELFSASGFDAVSIEQIAEKAEVGVGTVYNYFANKNALLLEVFTRDSQVMLERGSAILDNPGDDPQSAIISLLKSYIDHMADYDKALLMELFGVVMSKPQGGLEDYMELDMALVAQIGQLIEIYKRNGIAKLGTDSMMAAMAIYGILFLDIMVFLSIKEMTVDQLFEGVSPKIDIVLHGIVRK